MAAPQETNKSYKMNIPLLLHFLVLMLPYFLVFFFVFLSILNSTLNGFLYLFGLMILYGIITIFSNTLNISSTENTSNPKCKILSEYHKGDPSFISGLYAYTFVYMLFPMIVFNITNAALILMLILFIFIDFFIRSYQLGCVNFTHIVTGTVLGAMIGLIWAYLLLNSGQKDLLYYESLSSNKESCKITNQSLKCTKRTSAAPL